MHVTEVTRIAQQAWDKTKDKNDPVWNECDPHHRQVFLATAQAVVASGWAVNDFEHAVKRLAQEATENSQSIAEAHSDHPTAHADELPLIAAQKLELPLAESKPNVPQINPPSPESEASSPKKTSSKKAKE